MKKQYLYAGISILCWSTTATVTKLLLGSLDSMQVLFVSSFFAFIFLLIINIVKGNIKDLLNYSLKDYIQIFCIGALGTFLYNLFLYLGINNMQASQAFIINYLWPIMTIIFACIILKEKLTLKKLIAILLSFIGVIIVTSNGDLLSIEKNSLMGALYCVLASISYGLFSVLNKGKNYDKFLSMMLFFLSSTLISFIYTIFTKNFCTLQTDQIMGLLWIGVFTAALSDTLWALALAKGDTAKISNLAYITPFLSLIWTGLILKENISVYAIIGLIIIVLGIFIQIKDTSKE